MALFQRKSQLAVEIESTEGTVNAPDAADAGIFVYDLQFTPDVQIVERDALRSVLSQLEHLVGRTSGKITGRVELAPSGVAGTAPSIGKILQICGLAETVVAVTSVTYNPDSDAGDGDGSSGTVDFNMDGIRFRIFGARGTGTFDVTGGEQGFFNFTITGLMDSSSVVDSALLAGVTYPTIKPPVFLQATATLQAVVMKTESFSLDIGNQVALRPDVTQATGYSAAAITARAPTATLDPEMELVAVRDDYGTLLAGTAVALAVGWGQTAGNIIAFAAPKAQVKALDQANREGIATNPNELGLRDGGSGDDEWTVAFT